MNKKLIKFFQSTRSPVDTVRCTRIWFGLFVPLLLTDKGVEEDEKTPLSHFCSVGDIVRCCGAASNTNLRRNPELHGHGKIHLRISMKRKYSGTMTYLWFLRTPLIMRSATWFESNVGTHLNYINQKF